MMMLNFINDDHKEMHEVLLQRGFTFEVDVFIGGVFWDFIYKGETFGFSMMFSIRSPSSHMWAHYYDCTFETWDFYKPLNGKSFKEVTEYFTPEECRTASQRVTNNTTITADNIKAALKYNNIEDVEVNSKVLFCRRPIFVIGFHNPHWLAMLESYTGKLTPPPQTLTEWWNTNKKDGWDLIRDGNWHALYMTPPDMSVSAKVAIIPIAEHPIYKWSLAQQVELVGVLIKAYTLEEGSYSIE